MEIEIKKLPEKPDYLAPDCSEIRLLPTMRNGGLAHCTLDRARASRAVAHKSVEEIWYFFEGEGQVWLKQGEKEKVIDVYPDLSLTIPTGTHFQFRNMGQVPLRFLIVTMPPWPGPDEAYQVEGLWPSTECKQE